MFHTPAPIVFEVCCVNFATLLLLDMDMKCLPTTVYVCLPFMHVSCVKIHGERLEG